MQRMRTMSHIRTALYALLFLAQTFISVALDCYQCTGLSDQNDCHQVVQCPSDQHCFTLSIRSDATMLYTMGCMPATNCTESKTSAALIGRDVTDLPLRCSECCSVDACNRRLCGDTTQDRFSSTPAPITTPTTATTAELCTDLSVTDCEPSQLDTTCVDVSKMMMCQKSCHLCTTNCTEGPGCKNLIVDDVVCKDWQIRNICPRECGICDI